MNYPWDMRSVNVHEAKTQLSVPIAEVEERGERIVICRNGASVAALVPDRRNVSIAPDPKLGVFTIDYHPTEELSDADTPPEFSSGQPSTKPGQLNA